MYFCRDDTAAKINALLFSSCIQLILTRFLMMFLIKNMKLKEDFSVFYAAPTAVTTAGDDTRLM